MYILLLILIITIIIYGAATGGKSYKILESAKSTKIRQTIYRSWIKESWFLFGGLSILGGVLLLLTNQALLLSFNSQRLESIGLGAAFSMIAVLLFVITYSWRQSATISQAERNKTKQMIDKSSGGSLIAKNHEERRLAGLLSVAAGVNEELFFRLLLPATMLTVFGAEWLALVIIVSIVLFGVAHAYQGISGIVLTSLIGAFLMFIYMSTGSILLAIVVHILIDMRSVVGLSWVIYGRDK